MESYKVTTLDTSNNLDKNGLEENELIENDLNQFVNELTCM